MKEIKFQSRVSVAKPDDVYKGWIRISDDLRGDISNGAYVKVSANNRKVYCQVRGTPGKARRVEINEWYRNILGWTNSPNKAIEFTIKEVNLLGRISALSSHPDDIVRVGIGLGMISGGLGMLSVAAGLVGLLGVFQAVFPRITSLMTSIGLFTPIYGIELSNVVLLLIIGGLIIVGMFLLVRGLCAFFRKFPRPKN